MCYWEEYMNNTTEERDIKLLLSDSSGELKVKGFDINSSSAKRESVRILRKKILGKNLKDISSASIMQGVKNPEDLGYSKALASMIEEYKHLFVHPHHHGHQ
jgi:hypothetical protein